MYFSCYNITSSWKMYVKNIVYNYIYKCWHYFSAETEMKLKIILFKMKYDKFVLGGSLERMFLHINVLSFLQPLLS